MLTSDTADRPSRALARRLLGAAAVGLIVVVVWGTVTMVTPAAMRCAGLACVGAVIVVGAGAAFVASVAAWPALYLLRVRPAWPVALVGAVALGGFGWLVISGLGQLSALAQVPPLSYIAASLGAGPALLLVASPLSYVAAAFATAAGVRWWLRVVLVILLALAYPLAWLT